VMLYQCERLSHSYNGHPVFDLPRLAVPEGSRFAVVGPNGSGKTTLLEILVGLLEPSEGALRFFDAPMCLPLSAEMRSRIGYVSQQPFALPGKVLEGVMLALGSAGLRTERKARAMAALERLGIAALAERSERLLSVGQLRLVALARALAREAPLLVLDEPFAFGDETFEARLGQALDDHHRSGGTVIMTSPRPATLSGWATDSLELPGQVRTVGGSISALG